MRGAGSGKLPTLLQITGSAPAARVPVRMLLDRQIPNEPGVGAVVPQHCLLSGRGKQAEPGHTNTLAKTTDIYEEVKRLCLTHLEVGSLCRDFYDDLR